MGVYFGGTTDKELIEELQARGYKVIPVSRTEKLKIRLKLKYLTREINWLVDCNFGYSPKDKRFDDLVEQRNAFANIAKERYPEIYEEYEKYH